MCSRSFYGAVGQSLWSVYHHTFPIIKNKRKMGILYLENTLILLPRSDFGGLHLVLVQVRGPGLS